MFTFRLWRRIHKPFLFFVFCCSSILLLTKASVVHSTVSGTDASTLSLEDLESSLTMMENDDDDKYENLSVDDDENMIPVQPIQQLPYCGSRNVKKSSRDSAFEQAALYNGSENVSDSEEIVLKNDKNLKVERHILVATLDGRISLLDSGGKMIWSVCTGHLFSSTISSLQLTDRGKFIKLIPSLTGGLYKYDGESIQAMPLNAESLLKRSFKLVQDVVITGGKELRTFGVNVDSGQIKYECGISGCKSPTTAEFTSEEETSGIVLVIKKQLQTVRAIDSTTGIERWNFSVGTHELALAGVTNGCYEPAAAEESSSHQSRNTLRMIISEGVIFGTDNQNKAVWKHKFDSPISQSWILEDSQLHIVDPIKSSALLEDSPSLYVGIHKQQLYVQESHSTSKKLMDAMELEDGNHSEFSIEPLQIAWRPSRTTTSLNPPALIGDMNDNKALVPMYAEPFFVYERDEVKQSKPLAIEAPPPKSPVGICLHGDDMEEIVEVNANEDSVDVSVIIGLATLWFWWKEVLGISLLTAVILNVLLFRPVVHLTRRRTIAEITPEIVQQVYLYLTARNREQQQLALPDSSTSSNETELPFSVNRIRSVSTSSTHSSQPEEQIVPFVSQYLKEFEPVQCLGRGAFGIVFEAKKKIDDRNYAVKRIALPNREKSRDRVMREVKALARLDHKNIVRYFNAWIENPPQGWLEKNDPLWNSLNLNSPSPTYEQYPSSVFENRDDQSLMRKDHSEIFVLDQTPENGDDSFIVFENESNSEVSGITFASPLENGKIEDSDWLEDDEIESHRCDNKTSDPLSVVVTDTCGTNSKFFRRPTTLDIPSSTDMEIKSHGDWNISVNIQCDGENPLSIMYLYIQQELCQKRTLQDWLRHEKHRNLKHVMVMFAQLVEAVEYIHANNLIHRDLKPGNIFLAGGNGSSDGDQMTVKIGDFGLATTLVGNELSSSSGDIRVGEIDTLKPTSAKLTGHVGTVLYMAPEQFQRKVYDHKVDIYSLGLIFFELLVPFSTDMEKHTELHKLRQLKFPNHFANSHPDQYELIRDMVSHDPNSRPDASEIKLNLTKHLHGTTIRSRSYPEHLMIDTNQHIRTNYNFRSRDKDSRHIYKTHSAM